ncbi:iron-siderophore ABC transporter substrate-binding protein [Nocardia terpenica]|uniref:Transporter n=1 Tax=Nocardia terpenica TaxID=455432 RepID=A0A291RQL4_9NOCA|nr:iron-siderophore ABC transporter substrate-binding protein [Nocardia terpenica]ATL69589.1 transporter [Nocardia terpenica]
MAVIEVDSTRNTKARNRTRARRLRAGSAALVAAAALLTACGTGSDDDASIVRTTTNIAGADVVGIERDTRQACPLPTDPDQTSGTHAVNGVQAPADPQRIVVLDTPALDAACSLGLWKRIVGAATVAGPTPQPSYLGTGIAIVPGIGAVGSPDAAKIAALHPDLIVGTAGDGGADALRDIAPTVLVPAGTWQDTYTAYADAMGRRGAAAKALDAYHADARDLGARIAASFSQASVVRFSGNDIQVLGDDSFAGRVLADAGVQRPGPQRAHSYTVNALGTEAERAKVEGDIIYVLFDGDEGKSYGQRVMKGADWKKLGAATDKRLFNVEDDIWHGSGVTAARAMLEDLRATLNAYVSD